MEIKQIVNEAIPQETCPRKEAAARQRRKVLEDRIKKIADPRDKTQPFMPDLEYKNSLAVLGERSESWGGEPLNTSKNALS